ASDKAGIPTGSGPQQKLGVARQQFENFHQFDVENLADCGDYLIEKFLQVTLRQCALAEPSKRFLLTCADANLPIDAQALGYVTAGSKQWNSEPVLQHHRCRSLEPALLMVGRAGHAIFNAAWLERAQAFVNCSKHSLPRHQLPWCNREGALKL